MQLWPSAFLPLEQDTYLSFVFLHFFLFHPPFSSSKCRLFSEPKKNKDEGTPVLVSGAGKNFSRIIHDDYLFPSMLLFISCKKHRDSVFAIAE